MGRPIDLIIGKIEEMHNEKCAGWEAFFKSDYALEEAREEIVKLKKKIRELRNGSKIKG